MYKISLVKTATTTYMYTTIYNLHIRLYKEKIIMWLNGKKPEGIEHKLTNIFRLY